MEKDYKQTGGRNREEGLENIMLESDGWQCWPIDVLTVTFGIFYTLSRHDHNAWSTLRLQA